MSPTSKKSDPIFSTSRRREFRLRNPELIGNLVERIPDDLDIAKLRIDWWYDETPPGGKRAGYKEHVPCSCCRQRRLHWVGCVVCLPDGRYALVGNDCGMRELGSAYQIMKNAFKNEAKLAYGLERLERMRDTVTSATAELETLEAAVAVTGFDQYFRDMTHKFGRMSRHLAVSVKSNQGQLIATEEVFDEQATERDARRAAKKLVEGTDELDLYSAIDDAGTAEERRIAVARWRKFAARQPKRYKRQPLYMGDCEAWPILLANQRSTPAQLVREANQLVAPHALRILTKPDHEWSNHSLGQMQNDLKTAFGKIDAAEKLVASLIAFCTSANMRRVAAWAQQVQKMEAKLGQDIVADGSALCDDRSGSRLQLPNGYDWPALSGLEAFRRSTEASENEKSMRL